MHLSLRKSSLISKISREREGGLEVIFGLSSSK